MYMQHLPFGSVYVIAVKSMEWCGWEENRTQLISWELCEHTWGRNLILQSEWEEDEMLGVVLLKPPFQLQLFLIFPRNETKVTPNQNSSMGEWSDRGFPEYPFWAS